MVRKITPDDKQVYIEMSREFYSTDAVYEPVPDLYFERTFEEMMRSDVYAEAFMLETEGTVAGYGLIAKTFSQEAGGIQVWIEELYIRPEFRSKGLGSEFFKEIERLVPAARYRLEIEPENEGAVRLYRRLGFSDLPYGQMIKRKEGR